MTWNLLRFIDVEQKKKGSYGRVSRQRQRVQ